MRKLTILGYIFLFIIWLSGCIQIVDSYKLFSIDVFSEFDGITSHAEQEEYLRSGGLDFAKISDTVLVPLIKETTYTDCTLFIYAYFADENCPITIDWITLSTQDGRVLSEKTGVSAFNCVESMETETMCVKVALVETFPITETWYFSGNKLTLSYQITMETEGGSVTQTATHEVVLIGQKSFLVPT